MARSIPRRQFLRIGGTLLGVGAVGIGPSVHAKKKAKPPNIIYVFSDEHRWQSMSFSEMPEVQTPNMAGLARQGVCFTHCVSNYPVCSPHRAMLLTGRWPYAQGMIDNGLELGANEATIGKAFQSAGYATGYIGKWHLGGVRAEPFGFNTSLIWTGESKHWQGAYHPRDAKPVQSTGYNAARMTDQALEFIKANRKRPFFLMLSLHPPHSNFLDPPEAKKALYPKGSLPWRPNVPEAIRQSDSEDKSVLKQNGWPFYRGYHAHISAIDDELGRIMAALEKSGIDERTILVYSSDHGSMHGSHACGGKRMPQEESIRVPFLARGPGIAPGTVADALFGTIDVMPTLCSLAGVAIPSSCVGQDFSGWCRGGKGPDPETQFIMHISKENASGGINHPAPLWRGVRTRRHTYAVRAEKSWLLHDNQDDPYQMKNLVEDPAAASVKERLHTILVDQLKRAGDPFVMPW